MRPIAASPNKKAANREERVPQGAIGGSTSNFSWRYYRWTMRLRLVCTLAICAASLFGQSLDVATIAYDSSSAQLRFAASEIRRAFAGAGTAVVECGLNEIATAPQSRIFVLASGDAQS